MFFYFYVRFHRTAEVYDSAYKTLMSIAVFFDIVAQVTFNHVITPRFLI